MLQEQEVALEAVPQGTRSGASKWCSCVRVARVAERVREREREKERERERKRERESQREGEREFVLLNGFFEDAQQEMSHATILPECPADLSNNLRHSG